MITLVYDISEQPWNAAAKTEFRINISPGVLPHQALDL
jgi:hypothetical protein